MPKLSRKKIGNLLQFTILNLLDLDKQYHRSDKDYIWCDDYEQIEWMKYLFDGEEKYFSYDPPYRAKDNPLFSKDRVKEYCEDLLQLHTDVLVNIDNKIKTLYIIEAKRGLDILVFCTNREWEKIFISNFNSYYNDLVLQHFSDFPITITKDECYGLEDTGSILRIQNSTEYDKGVKKTWNILAQET